MANQEDSARTADALKRAFCADMNNARNNLAYADFTIKCGTEAWQVHKIIITSRCEFFKPLCDGGFKEAHDACVTLDDDPPQAVKAMIDFLYGCDISLIDSGTGQVDLTLCRMICNLANKYMLPGLKHIATTAFNDEVHKIWESPKFGTAVKDVYDHAHEGDDTLLQILVKVGKLHISAMLGNNAAHHAMHDAVRQVPAFLADVAKAQFAINASDAESWVYMKCPDETCQVPGKVSFAISWKVYNEVDGQVRCPDGCNSDGPMPYEVELGNADIQDWRYYKCPDPECYAHDPVTFAVPAEYDQTKMDCCAYWCDVETDEWDRWEVKLD